MVTFFPPQNMAMLSIFIIFLSLSWHQAFSSVVEFPVPSGGPESFVFDADGAIYTGVNDGRVVKKAESDSEFGDFAYASPTRTKELCDGTTDPQMGSICGRTLGLGYYKKTKEIYLADAYHGLCVVGSKGGLATQLLSSVDGLPLLWLDGLDIDQTTGNVYFTDVSVKYNFSQVAEHIITGDATGRFIEYNPTTKIARVLLSPLKGPGGAAVSKDGSFVLVSEFPGSRITKYWLKGSKKDTSELLLNISGPANIKLTPSGDFWVAVNGELTAVVPMGVRIDTSGNILETVPLTSAYGNNISINEVHQRFDSLYLASLVSENAVVYDPPRGDWLHKEF